MPSQIAWTNETWNPVTGCTKVSPGCAHCYAEAVTLRWKLGPAFLPGIAEIKLHPDRLDKPLRWKKPRMVFVNSMSDLFHEDVPDEFILQVFAVMGKAEHHIFQVLTKRPERMLEWLNISYQVITDFADQRNHPYPVWPLPNVWLGVSVENQHWADIRIPLLLQTPAAVRFISAEPLLKPIDLWPWVGKVAVNACQVTTTNPDTLSALGKLVDAVVAKNFPTLSWVIAGGESGPKHRPMDVSWAQSLADQCEVAGVPFFMKQDSGPRPGQQGRLPDDLWNRKEFPHA